MGDVTEVYGMFWFNGYDSSDSLMRNGLMDYGINLLENAQERPRYQTSWL